MNHSILELARGYTLAGKSYLVKALRPARVRHIDVAVGAIQRVHACTNQSGALLAQVLSYEYEV